MTVHTFYRLALGLPLLVPAATAAVVHLLGWQPATPLVHKGVQVILMSGVYGGLPYALLAAYGIWWIDRRPEREIRRRALLAPLLMVGAWVPLALLVGVLYGSAEVFLRLLALGTVVILPLGYAWVGLVFLLRSLVPTAGREGSA